jgi:putative CocE/NonD family hydrolase
VLFTTPAPTSAVAITGPVSVQLYVSSNATDTDFTVKFIDLYINGRAALIQDSVTRMRWLDVPLSNTSQPMVPGVIYEITMSLSSTSYIFDVGHSIRIAVSSSNYPRYSVNPNNENPLLQNGTMYTAANSIYFGPAHPSALFLPLVNASQLPHVPVTDAASDAFTRMYRDAFAGKDWKAQAGVVEPCGPFGR